MHAAYAGKLTRLYLNRAGSPAIPATRIDRDGTERKRSRAEEKSYAALQLELIEIEQWPAGLDADLVKWFRGLGAGYQARINAVLRCHMLAVVWKEILLRSDKDWRTDLISGEGAAGWRR